MCENVLCVTTPWDVPIPPLELNECTCVDLYESEEGSEHRTSTSQSMNCGWGAFISVNIDWRARSSGEWSAVCPMNPVIVSEWTLKSTVSWSWWWEFKPKTSADMKCQAVQRRRRPVTIRIGGWMNFLCHASTRIWWVQELFYYYCPSCCVCLGVLNFASSPLFPS